MFNPLHARSRKYPMGESSAARSGDTALCVDDGEDGAFIFD